MTGFDAFKDYVNIAFGPDMLEDADRKKLEEMGYTVLRASLQLKFGQKVPAQLIKKVLQAKARMNEAKRGIK